MDQLETDREYLNHVLRNSTARIEGCLKEIETTLLEMAAAVKTFRETCENDFADAKSCRENVRTCERRDARPCVSTNPAQSPK